MLSSSLITVSSIWCLLLLIQIPTSTLAANRKESPTKPGEVQHIQWMNGTIIDPFAAQIGLPPSLRQSIVQYCEESGITDLFKKLFFSEFLFF